MIDRMNAASEAKKMREIDSKKTYKKFAKYYDIYVKDFSGDIPLYLSFCRKNDEILEVGCGSGRILKPFLENGYKITGVDISNEMLELSEQKLKGYIENGSLKLKNLDFRYYSLKETYDKIMITWFTFNYILEEKEQLSFLKNIYLSLKDKGLLIMDLFYPQTLINPEIENKWKFSGIRKDGIEIKLKDKRKIVKGIEERIQIFNVNNTEEKIITHRIFIDKNKIRQLLESAGFKGVKFTDGYDYNGFHDPTGDEKAFKNYVVVAGK